MSLYVTFYIWEILPNGDFWWSAPTLISLYAFVCIVCVISIKKFTDAGKK